MCACNIFTSYFSLKDYSDQNPAISEETIWSFLLDLAMVIKECWHHFQFADILRIVIDLV